jgi:DNA-binding NtrC family response regulator
MDIKEVTTSHAFEKVRRILVVDDEPEICDCLRAILSEELGLVVDVAYNGTEALVKAQRETYFTVLCDIRMPGIQGTELLAEFIKRGKNIPFIYLTGHGGRNEMVQVIRLGAFDFLEKPINQRALVDVVQRAVEVGLRESLSENAPESVTTKKNRRINQLLRLMNHSRRT